MRARYTFAAIVATLSLVDVALGQTVPIGNVLPQIPEPRPDFRRDTLPPEQAAPVARELGKPDDDITIDVTDYRIEGGPPELAALAKDITRGFTGPHRHYEDLINAVNAVTRHLQGELGYYLGYAYLPEQVPENGVVRIAVLEGWLDRVDVVWPAEPLPVDREVVQRYLDHFVPGAVLTVREVERTIFLLNDLHGISVRFEVRSGSRPGTARLVAHPVAERNLAARVDIDNFGSRYSGLMRAAVGADWASPGGRGDKLSVNALTTTDAGLRFALAGYSRPVGDDGLKIGATLSFVEYGLDRTLLPLDLHGHAFASTGYALYPIVRSRNLNTFVLASIEQKSYSDAQGANGIDTDKHTNSQSLSLSGDFRDSLAGGAVSTYELSYSTGKLIYDSPRPAGLDNPERYAKANYAYTRLQSVINGRLLGYLNLRGQRARTNLDTTEQFRIGGPEGVRAFAPGEGTGDEGVLVTGELRLLPPEALLGSLAREFVVSAFYDWGRWRARRDESGQPSSFINHGILSGGGVGGAWEGGRDFIAKASVAWRGRGAAVADPSNRNPRIYFQLTRKF